MPFRPGQSGNPAGRPKGSINKQLAMLRDAVEKVLPLVVERALNGDTEAQKLILERGLPKLKPVETPLEFTLPDENCPAPRRAILEQAAEGAISLDVAEEIIAQLRVLEKEGVMPRDSTTTKYINAYLRQLVNAHNDQHQRF